MLKHNLTFLILSPEFQTIQNQNGFLLRQIGKAHGKTQYRLKGHSSAMEFQRQRNNHTQYRLKGHGKTQMEDNTFRPLEQYTVLSGPLR